MEGEESTFRRAGRRKTLKSQEQEVDRKPDFLTWMLVDFTLVLSVYQPDLTDTGKCKDFGWW